MLQTLTSTNNLKRKFQVECIKKFNFTGGRQVREIGVSVVGNRIC